MTPDTSLPKHGSLGVKQKNRRSRVPGIGGGAKGYPRNTGIAHGPGRHGGAQGMEGWGPRHS